MEEGIPNVVGNNELTAVVREGRECRFMGRDLACRCVVAHKLEPCWSFDVTGFIVKLGI
jgi:hypothetical protein